MADEKKAKTVRLEPEQPKKFEDSPASLADGKKHVRFFLQAMDVPAWELRAKVDFAKHHKQEFGTDEEFKQLFGEKFSKF